MSKMMPLLLLRRLRRIYRLKTIRRFIILCVTASSTLTCMFLIYNSNLFKPRVYYSLAELELMQPHLSIELARLRGLLPYPSNESLAAMHFWLLWRAAVLFPRSNVNHSYSCLVVSESNEEPFLNGATHSQKQQCLLCPPTHFNVGDLTYSPNHINNLIDRPLEQTLEHVNKFDVSALETLLHSTPEAFVQKQRLASSPLTALPLCAGGQPVRPLSPVRAEDRDSHESLTLVSGFFDLSSISAASKYSSERYAEWMRAYRRVTNPLLFFTDSAAFFSGMRRVRRNRQNLTRLFRVERHELGTFRLYEHITQNILSRASYIYNGWNTRLPEYCLTMHAKYELVAMAVRLDLFRTPYLAWSDVGIFRFLNLTAAAPPLRISLRPPAGFDEARVAYTLAEERSWKEPAFQVVFNGLDWLAGGFFVGTRATLSKWVAQYRFYHEWLLSRGETRTDQQVLLVMFTREGRASYPFQLDSVDSLQRPRPLPRHRLEPGPAPPGAALGSFVEVQPFQMPDSLAVDKDKWFYLPYLCYLAGQNHTSSLPYQVP